MTCPNCGQAFDDPRCPHCGWAHRRSDGSALAAALVILAVLAALPAALLGACILAPSSGVFDSRGSGHTAGWLLVAFAVLAPLAAIANLVRESRT